MLSITKGASKLLLPLGKKPMIYYALKEAAESGAAKIHVVLNKEDTEVRQYLETTEFFPKINIVYQKEAKGVGDALQQAQKDLSGDFFGVIFPDTFIAAEEPALVQVRKVFGCLIQGTFFDAGVPSGYERTRAYIEEQERKPKEGRM